MGERTKRTSEKAEDRKGNALKVAEVIAKLAAAGALIAATFIANNYQQRMAGASLMSQREQAESQLRASMFSNLIGPIVGPSDSAEIPVDRERLLVELLALNFHEHFEFKPLLEHVDEGLLEKRPDDMEKQRRSLVSIARRVADRQLAQLMRDGATSFNIFAGHDHGGDAATCPGDGRCIGLQQSTFFYSAENTLMLQVDSLDADAGTVDVSFAVMDSVPDAGADAHFTLTPFDFPYTDNTLLSDGSRFCITLQEVAEDEATLKLVWFPEGFYGPRERPFAPEFRRMMHNDDRSLIARVRGWFTDEPVFDIRAANAAE